MSLFGLPTINETAMENCYFSIFSKKENIVEKIHYHLGKVMLNFKGSATISDTFKGLRFDLGNSITNEGVDEAAVRLINREYNGAIR